MLRGRKEFWRKRVGENELDCRKGKVGGVDVDDDIKNKEGKISFNELVKIVIERTSASNKGGKVRFTTGDMAEVSRVMHEIMSTYAELEKKFVQKVVDFEKMEENFIWAKNYQEQEKVRFTRELARIQREVDIVQELGKMRESLQRIEAQGARKGWQSEYEGVDKKRAVESEGVKVGRGSRELVKECQNGNNKELVGVEDRRLDRKVSKQLETGTESESEWETVAKKKKTFADVAKLGRAKLAKERPGWKTPPRVVPTQGHELRVKKEGKKGLEWVREIKDIIKNLGVRAIRTIKEVEEGKVLIVFEKLEDYEKVREFMEGVDGTMLGNTGGILPKLKLSGVEKGYTDEEIIQAILDENPELFVERESVFWKEGMRVVYRKPCLKQFKENVILEMRGETFRKMVKAERIYLDMRVIYVEESTEIGVCFRCSRYGHTDGRCKEAKCCYRCGSEHEGRECEKDVEWDCANCKRAGVAAGERRHMAVDKRCPVYRRKVEQRRGITNY